MKEVSVEGDKAGRRDYSKDITASTIPITRVHQAVMTYRNEWFGLPSGYYMTFWATEEEEPPPRIWYEASATVPINGLIWLFLQIVDKDTGEVLENLPKHYGYGNVKIKTRVGFPVMRNENEMLHLLVGNYTGETTDVYIRGSGLIDYTPHELKELR